MAKKILIISSSPRKTGNTATLAAWVAEGATQAGAQVETVDLAGITNQTHGCCSCFLCQPDKLRCAIPDGTTELLSRLAAFDTLVFASPVYFFSFNAQMKQFIDRFMSLVPADAPSKSPLANLKFAIVATGGGDEKDSGVDNMKANLRSITDFVGAPAPRVLFEGGLGSDVEVLKTRAGARAKALDFGAKLAR